MKNFMQSGSVKAPHVSGKVGNAIPGSSARARMMEAQGQSVKTGKAAASAKDYGPDRVTVASGNDMVMPVDHASAKTTRTVSKGGTL